MSRPTKFGDEERLQSVRLITIEATIGPTVKASIPISHGLANRIPARASRRSDAERRRRPEDRPTARSGGGEAGGTFTATPAVI
ncbi:hypothetical protein Pen02_29340 [Plantactinospora endophytica]|uniref:Uncharacterized protein n=1 Tax=Plantactinospora endophytica TaxID=673535 RepID=A0ABQ4DZU5_9ACTN|nr:hypothetical protein Pen02_29340 [Plantactinospora endophytica]